MTHRPATYRPATHRRSPAGALLGILLLGACYRAVPVTGPAAPAPGRRVVVSLTADGTRDLAAQLGPGVVRAEGEIVAARGDTIELALVRTEQMRGTDHLWQRQPVRLPRAAVASLAERRLDRRRSWLAAAGLVALGLAATFLFGDTVLGEGRTGGVMEPN